MEGMFLLSRLMSYLLSNKSIFYINFPDLFGLASPLKSIAHQKHQTLSSVHRTVQKKTKK